jgi:hypothetical protein
MLRLPCAGFLPANLSRFRLALAVRSSGVTVSRLRLPPIRPPFTRSSPPASQTACRAQWVESLIQNTCDLTDAHAHALAHAAQYGQHVKAEDVRQLMITAFINISQSQRRA